MKTPSWILTIATALVATGTALAQQSGPLPKVRVLATGGTIAGAQASATDYGYKSGAYDVNSLLKAVPNLDKPLNFRSPLDVPSFHVVPLRSHVEPVSHGILIVSADGPGNIYNGVAVLADRGARGKGTLVSLNDEIHYARNVVKTDTTSVQTFRSLNRGPAGVVHTGKIEWFEPMDRKETTDGIKVPKLA